MIKFRLAAHTSRTEQIVEIVEVNGKEESVIGAVYVEGALSIKITSAHIAGFVMDDGRGRSPPYPVYSFTFDPQSYMFGLHQIIRMNSLGNID